MAAATWGLEAAEVQPIGHGKTSAALRERGECVVFHDPLCPMTPPDLIAECVAELLESPPSWVDLVAILSEINLKLAPALAARVHDDVERQMLEAASRVVPSG